MSWLGDWLGEWFGAWFSGNETGSHEASGASVFPATSGSGSATHGGSLSGHGGGYHRLIAAMTGKRRVRHRARGCGEFIASGHGQAAVYRMHRAHGRGEFIASGHGQAAVYRMHRAHGRGEFITSGHGAGDLWLGDDQLAVISDFALAW